MRALTVKQPWAWAIIHGGKYAENRPWSTRVRGPIAIHAGARPRVVDLAAFGAVSRWATAEPPWNAVRFGGNPEGRLDSVTCGAVIGVVDLVDCHEAAGCCAPWGQPTGWHFVLENPRPIVRPLSALGRQRFWHDVDLFTEVRHALRDAT